MKAMKNGRSALVFDRKLLKELMSVFGFYYKNSFGSGNIITSNLTHFTWCSTPTHQH